MDSKCFYLELMGLTPGATTRFVVPRKRDEDSGLYEEVYTDEDFLDVLSETRLSTSEVAEELDCHRTTAHEKLSSMEDEGLLVSTQAGNTFIWEVTD